MVNPYRVLNVHIQNDVQAELVASFLQSLNIDYEELQGEEWVCNLCGQPESSHFDEECPTL